VRFLTSALDVGQVGVLAALPEGKSQSERYVQDKNLAPAGNRTPAVQPIARIYND
jgi:hypothetical protein